MIRYPSLNVSGLLAGVYVWWRSRVSAMQVVGIASTHTSLALARSLWSPISLDYCFWLCST